MVCISETWETSKTDRKEIEEKYKLTWLSKHRRNARGGGVAVIAKNDFADISILDVAVPPQLELIWVSVTPRVPVQEKIMVACFYSSGTAKFKPPKDLLQDHILDVIINHISKDDRIKVLACGDLNQDDLSSIIELPSFHQDIDRPTLGHSYLEKAVSNLNVPKCRTHPELAPDKTNKGKKSDHRIATLDYILHKKKTRSWFVRKRCQYSEQRLAAFREEFRSMNWWKLLSGTSDQKAEAFQAILLSMVDKHFPFEDVRVREGDAVWYTPKLRREKRQLKKKYKKGATEHFKAAKARYVRNVKNVSKKFF